jgi:DNA-binding transcriptional LysR family regulator
LATVAELGQLTRAAEVLHVSQPAITAQIKALEDEVGLALFERTPSGMLLTMAGERLLAHAQKVLAATQAFKNEAKALSGEVAGKVSVGTVSDPEFIRLGEFLNKTVEHFPLIQLELQQQVSGTALERVRDRSLDASFYFGELGNANVAGLRLRDIVYCVAAPSAWKDRVANADWTQIATQPWILTPSVSTHNQLVHELFREHGAEPAKVVEADQESVINSLIVSCVGLSLMREDQARAAEAAGEVVVWGKSRLATKLWFIHCAERADDPVIRALVEVIRACWNLTPKPGKSRNASRGALGGTSAPPLAEGQGQGRSGGVA